MRILKHHEKRLLKKVNFIEGWKHERNVREIKVLRRYLIQDREDYVKYNKMVGMITKLTSKLKQLKSNDKFRQEVTQELLNKLYNMGMISSAASLLKAEKMSVSAIARRRLPVVMVRLRMAQTLKEAVTFVEQGHVRVGPEVVTDPAFIVTRAFEDFVTWVDSSKIRRTVAKYNDKLDDYELLGL